MKRKTPPLLEETECALFRRSVGQVTLIHSDKVLLTPPPKRSPRITPQPTDYAAKLSSKLPEALENVAQEDTLHYLAPGLQKNVLKKLRQGYYGLDAELDLHGLTREAAKQQLLKFLHHCIEDGCRCVHIIHGKGYRSLDNHPVLKNQLNHWLRQHNDVQAFCSASPKNGGAGAVMVLLHSAEKYRNDDFDF